MNEDTIVAIATPVGKAGVAIVRLSGKNCYEILQKITQCSNDFLPRYMYFKTIHFFDIMDNALVVYFKSPNSYTGEDVVEFQCHGGYFVAEQVLKQCINYGARLACPGEFSKRAFLNGKMSIDQAEGIMDIINAETEAQARAGSELINGNLFNLISNEQKNLTDVIAELEAKLDYPEYDFFGEETKNISDKLKEIESNLNLLLSTKLNGIKIKNGVKIAIVGKPNVGKSSLLNCLTNSNKAIVTDVAGTTRDIIEGEYVFKGILFRLFDTAGIHESQDLVEKIGIERAIESINSADIVLKLQEFDSDFTLEIKDKPYLNVITKADLIGEKNITDEKTIIISSVTNYNIEKLKQRIYELTMVGGYDNKQLYLTNTRHIQAITDGLIALNRAIEQLDKISLDFIVSDLKICWHKIGEITGQTSNEDIIDRIFEKFCLGK